MGFESLEVENSGSMMQAFGIYRVEVLVRLAEV